MLATMILALRAEFPGLNTRDFAPAHQRMRRVSQAAARLPNCGAGLGRTDLVVAQLKP